MQPIEPVWWDAIPMVLLCCGAPALAAFVTVPRIRALSAAEQDRMRPRLYANVMVSQWLFGIAAMLPWLIRDEPLAAIGLGAPGGLWPVAAAACGLGGIALLWQRRSIKRNVDGAHAVRGQLARVSWVIPRTRKDLALWGLICLHAGVFEELFYRGYLLAIARGLGPDWLALPAVTILFGLGHLYQGAKGIVQTALIGAVFLALAWFSESLWLPMLAHALFDWHAGTLGRWALYGKAN